MVEWQTPGTLKQNRSIPQGNRGHECWLIRRTPHRGNAEPNRQFHLTEVCRDYIPAACSQTVWPRHSPDCNVRTALATECSKKIPCFTACGFESRHQHKKPSFATGAGFSLSFLVGFMVVFDIPSNRLISFVSYLSHSPSLYRGQIGVRPSPSM